MLVVTKKDVEKLVPLKDIKSVVGAVEQAFFEYGIGNVQMPPKMYLYFKEYDGDLRIMPSYSSKLNMAGTKIVNVHPNNPKKGLFTVMASIILNDVKTGVAIAFIEGTYITGMRTGAAGAVAAKYLAKKDAKTLGLIGAGYQSIFQVAAIIKVRNIKEIVAYDVKDESISKLEKLLNKEGIKVKIKSVSLEEAAKQDILVTTTPAREPVLKREWIQPGTHINAIGADAEGKEELDPQILKDAKVVIDDWAQASHSGEINVPLKNGIITRESIYGELGEIVSGKKPGRENDNEITVFDSTGLGLQDLFAANLVYKKAKQKNVGKEIVF